MHPSLAILDEALAIAAKEEQALFTADVDTLEELFSQRLLLQEKAWEIRSGCNEQLFLERLSALKLTQEKLEALCKVAVLDVQQQLSTVRATQEYVKKSFYSSVPSVVFSKIS